jgi:hypothetical protein
MERNLMEANNVSHTLDYGAGGEKVLGKINFFCEIGFPF